MKHQEIKLITDGAIIVAIYAVFLLCSRFFSGFLEEFLYFIIPLPLTIYGYKYHFKNSIIVSIATSLLSFIVINPLSTIFYVIPTLVIGIIYPELLKRNSKTLVEFIFLIASFLIISLLTMVFFGYLFNYDIIEDTKVLAEQIINLFTLLGIKEERLVFIRSLVISLIPCIILLTSIMESVLLMIISKIMLYKMNLKNSISLKIRFSMSFMPQIIGYIYIIFFILMSFAFTQIPLENNLYILYSIIANIGIVFSFLMIYQGLFFLLEYSKIKHNKVYYILGIICVFIFPILVIFIGLLQNIFHLTLRL